MEAKDPSWQRTVADDHQELELQIGQLRETVLVLRQTLEQAQINADQQLQAVTTAFESEKQQLRVTIEALREQLEQQALDHAAALQSQRAEEAETMRQLQQALVHQRELLEQQAARASG